MDIANRLHELQLTESLLMRCRLRKDNFQMVVDHAPTAFELYEERGRRVYQEGKPCRCFIKLSFSRSKRVSFLNSINDLKIPPVIQQVTVKRSKKQEWRICFTLEGKFAVRLYAQKLTVFKMLVFAKRIKGKEKEWAYFEAQTKRRIQFRNPFGWI